MKKIVKRILTIAAFTFTLSLFLPATASPAKAAKPQASIKKKKYTTLKKALAKVKKGQTIKLLKNIKTSKTLTANRNVRYNLNLNKKKITYSGKNVALNLKKGNVTVSNGTITSIQLAKKTSLTTKKANIKTIGTSGGTILVKDGTIDTISISTGKCTIKNGTITSINNGIHYKKNQRGKLIVQNGNIDGIFHNAGTCTIYDGSIDSFSSRYADTTSSTTIKKGSYSNVTLGGTSIVENGTFKDFSNYGKLTIKNGVFGGKPTTSGKTSGKKVASNYLFQNLGTCVIYNGTYTYDYSSFVIYNDSAVTMKGGNFDVGFNISENGSLTIENGTFTNEDAWMFCNHGTLNIQGGTFKETSTEHELISNKAKLIIGGGSFESIDNVIKIQADKNVSTTVTISGGNFKSTQGIIMEIIALYDSKGNLHTPAVTITGGTFYKDANGVWYTGDNAPSIQGGTFI